MTFDDISGNLKSLLDIIPIFIIILSYGEGIEEEGAIPADTNARLFSEMIKA